MSARAAVVRVATLAAIAACGDGAGADPDATLFADISEAVLPRAIEVAPDPDDYSCDATSPNICVGASIGVGAAAGDVDGDGDVDLYLAGSSGGLLLLDQPGESTGYSLSGDASFDGGDVYVHGAAFGDLDRDGDLDLALATATGLRVLANDGAGAFVDVTGDLGVDVALQRSPSVAIADVDRDGLLDIHVSEYGEAQVPSHDSGPGLLLLNRGSLRFEDAAGPSGWPRRHAWASLFADVDGDGALDLFIASETWTDEPDEQPSSLYFFDGLDASGLPIWDERAKLAGDLARVSTPMAAVAGDPDRDGRTELLVSLTGPDMYIGETGGADPRELEGTSYFGPLPLEEAQHSSWGAALEDFDGDGHVEALVVGGAPCVAEVCDWFVIPVVQQPVLLRYAGDEFVQTAEHPVPLAGGLASDGGEYRNGHGLVLADFGGDLRDEVVITPFDDRFRIYDNVGAEGSTLRLRLRGTTSAPTPYGARVEVVAGGATYRRQLTSGGSTHCQREPALLFELGAATAIDSLSIEWPSGFVQRPVAPAVDQRVEVVEPALLSVPKRVLQLGVDDTIEAFVQRYGDDGQPAADDSLDGIELTADDAVPFAVESLGGGRFRATRPAPDTAGVVRVQLTLDGLSLRVRPAVFVR